jgi:hypothetical protein
MDSFGDVESVDSKKRPCANGKGNVSKNETKISLVQDSDEEELSVPKSNYLSEETLSALLGTSDLLDTDLASSFATSFEQLGILPKAGLRSIVERYEKSLPEFPERRQ